MRDAAVRAEALGVAFIVAALWGCGVPEALHRRPDGGTGLGGAGGRGGGAGGTSGTGVAGASGGGAGGGAAGDTGSGGGGSGGAGGGGSGTAGAGGGTAGAGGGAAGAGGGGTGAAGASGGSGGGAAGAGGAAGSGGAAGAAGGSGGGGAGGAGGTAALSCTPPFSPATGLLSDFSATTWSATTGKWGTAGNLTGSIFSYKGPNAATTWNAAAVPAAALVLGGTVAVGDYAGGGMSFDQCVNTTAYTGFRFTLGGTAAGCTVLFEVQTFSQQSTANRGGCNTGTATCYQFPRVTTAIAAAPITVRFTDLATTGLPATAAALSAEMVGLQWQLQSSSGAACTGVNVTIDDVALVP